MELSLRMKEYREYFGWTQTDLSEKSGVSISTIKKYEAGSVDNFTYGNLKKIASAFNLSPASFISENMSDNSPTISNKICPTSNVILENFTQTLNDDMINIPFFENVRASAGSGAYNDEESTQALGLSKSFLRECFGLYSFINLSVILGQGDSMTPTLPENCYLLIQQGEVAEGEICVTRIEDELYVKRLQKRPKLKLLSDNKAYEPINLEGENFEILGRVVGYFKKTTL
ncbi:LexA family transcriptional regulator [Campylobacter jejuni]|uniref:XRE family transcriptional regulator n=1 Tax=Campylobacter jejuni TaxID=197 RepID=UPI000699BA94|nr:XRE family transcriptional regulator [Campylobacter jejuni]EAH7205728.1 LexA family transcriptional regulator [Campylobacter jejuni]EAI3757248.1 LexA family transcriptional regulator [Campylobacter jejuni]EAI5676085.1 LexA family transcriptional regulator [Campylobacter jejuni]EAI7267291.1 LexA family transcriptional regulator [Campylobacter jejuni]EAI7472300.1 LexA family transcriptional regulator [Campylobacter jejuni]